MSNSMQSNSAANKATHFKYKHLQFLVMDAPTDSNLDSYIEVMQKRRVSAVVRACQPTYSTAPLDKCGIKVFEVPFADGDPPPEEIITQWLAIVHRELPENVPEEEQKCIAVHCVAGLGRAPALVAIALIESGMPNLDVISFIRKKRRGAINARQLKYLEVYVPRSKAKCCVIC